MKKRAAIFFCVLLLITACKKDNSPGKYFGNASATLNGAFWQTDNIRTVADQACYHGALGIEMHQFNSQGFLREVLVFSKVQVATGVQEIYNASFQNSRCNDTLDATYFTHADDGDVISDEYAEIIGRGNHITIDAYDPVSQKLSGTFTVSFILTRRTSPTAPDTLHFTNGKFYAKIIN